VFGPHDHEEERPTVFLANWRGECGHYLFLAPAGVVDLWRLFKAQHADVLVSMSRPTFYKEPYLEVGPPRSSTTASDTVPPRKKRRTEMPADEQEADVIAVDSVLHSRAMTCPESEPQDACVVCRGGPCHSRCQGCGKPCHHFEGSPCLGLRLGEDGDETIWCARCPVPSIFVVQPEVSDAEPPTKRQSPTAPPPIQAPTRAATLISSKTKNPPRASNQRSLFDVGITAEQPRFEACGKGSRLIASYSQK
jgi:hypothetical protein